MGRDITLSGRTGISARFRRPWIAALPGSVASRRFEDWIEAVNYAGGLADRTGRTVTVTEEGSGPPTFTIHVEPKNNTNT